MAWNEPGNKDPWGRNKNNSSLDGVFKDFKKTIDDLLGSGSSVPPSPKKSAGLLSGIILAIYFLSGIYIVNDGYRMMTDDEPAEAIRRMMSRQRPAWAA